MIYLFALIAGICLTVMPCVLPVIGLKISALHGRKFPYIAGVLCSFMVIATLSVLLGTGLSLMGFVQYRALMVIVCVLMGTSLLGLWHMPSVGLSGDYGAFGMGIMSVALGSTCAVPFLAPVMVFVSEHGPIETYAVFLTMGVGSCWYLIIPGFKIPDFLRHYLSRADVAFGVIMVASGLYFAWSMPTTVVVWCVAFCASAIALNKLTSIKGLSAGQFRLLSFVMCGFMCLYGAKIGGHKINTEIPAQVITENGPRVIMVTADWCITCHTMKPTISDDRVVSRMQELGIVPIVLDYTDRAPSIGKFLATVKARDVPVLLIENSGGDVTVLTGVWSISQILAALE